MTTSDSSKDGMERLDENPRHVLNELVGILNDRVLDREPPITDKENGEIDGLEIAIDEINHLIENGDVRYIDTDIERGDD